MDELPTRPMPQAELKIIRTRHPPNTYLNQLCDLLGTEGISLTPIDLCAQLEEFPEKDRLILAVEGDQLQAEGAGSDARAIHAQRLAG